MKLIWYECKKICNWKLILFLLAFTFLFYQLFIWCIIHPEDSAGCVAADDLAYILQEEYGYKDGMLPYEDFSFLEEIRLEQLQQLDQLVLEYEALQAEGITSYEQLCDFALEELSEEAYNARLDIDFETGIRQVFLVQHIESIYEMMKYRPIMGIEDGRELEAAINFQDSSGNRNSSDFALSVIAKHMKKDQMSLLPDSIMRTHVSRDFPLIGILMIVSCMILVLPYQIREQLAGVLSLHKTTSIGRRLCKWQMGAVLLSSFIVSILQVIIFGIVLYRSNILQYFHFPINGTGISYYWLNVTFGTYFMINGLCYIFLALCLAMIFFLVSYIASNYIVGLGIGIPVTFALGWTIYTCMKCFLEIKNGFTDWIPYLSLFVFLGTISLLIYFKINEREQKGDI